MKLHSLVHLHHFFMEKVLGRKIAYPKTSDIQENLAFNRYETSDVTEDLAIKASNELMEFIKNDVQVKSYPDAKNKSFRFWEVGDMTVPCGGVHIGKISEIGVFETSFSRKKGKATVNFKLK